MFEKEADNWVIDSVCKDCSKYEKCKSKEHCTCKECSKEKWQKGADFGYNKANEWHFVNDGDLPKEEGEYLVIFESDGTKYKGLESYYLDTKEWSTICKIIAWKEIVLPELKESE